ncbi:Gamma-tubulin complex component [Rhynchospora pubera]|uniref:Gamma-tubulin complex component n=1 Tax=Rhynchospora pubera TaxID=906938 RepID=A0AAV8FFT1_9POAL|nr:Gamma-tubulin complex component [Rhynchospora pubera]KAJ4809279.1 Gamma-tubulin complex component [Rhynchospora pubera]
MTYPLVQEVHKFDVADSFITKLKLSISNGLPNSIPLSSLKTDEHDLVRGIVQMLQGLPNTLFYWDVELQCFHARPGIYASHLSQTSLKRLVNPFLLASSCLKRVEIFIAKVQCVGQRYPTLCAFANSVDSWLKRLRSNAIKEEELLLKPDNGKTTTLLGLINSLSRVCAGAEHLCQIIYEAVPGVFFNSGTTTVTILASEVAVHILNHLFNKLSDVCLVQGCQGNLYQMLLFLFVGTLLPYLQGLDSWLYDGILNDPFEEMFFYGNSSVTIDQPSFWETSYLLRSKPRSSVSQGGSAFSGTTCPQFLATMSKAIMSAGKSLQLVHHARDQSFVTSCTSKTGITCNRQDNKSKSARIMGILTLAEVFLISLVGLSNDRDHIFENLIKYPIDNQSLEMDNEEGNSKAWLIFLSDAIEGRNKNRSFGSGLDSFYACNPAVTVCGEMLEKNKSSWEELNISGSFYLPPLNDDILRKAVFGETHLDELGGIEGTDYRFGFRLGEVERLRLEEDKRALESLCSFPTILPSFPETKPLSDILPFQKDSTLSSRVLKFIQSMKLKESIDPAIIIQECLSVYIKRQVDHVGKSILHKLMGEWRLMDELFLLRSIYLLGSGDLLQQFLVVIFNRLDKGDSWDDDFELNTILQDSIRNSADRTLLSAPDSLTISVLKENATAETMKESTQPNFGNHNLGIDTLDKLCFSYKVSWPLDLIANVEALKKYNQVMGFLLKVKRAKFLLDKTRKWRWKDRDCTPQNYKKHLLIEQKLLHFVDSFHQYVMDRVYHSAWTELCSGMELAGSLDEVIDVHETYLSSIQRQCFVASDKLWALVASRVKTVLGLALDFYNVKQTLRTGGTSPAIKARCETEINRIAKQFDDCVAFLLRILSFKLNVSHFPHLADLVTRINYNYFYMSDSGNLLTVPRYESIVNLGKPPASRPNPN